MNTWLLTLGGGRKPRTMPPELAVDENCYLHLCATWAKGGAWSSAAVLHQQDARSPPYFSSRQRAFAGASALDCGL